MDSNFGFNRLAERFSLMGDSGMAKGTQKVLAGRSIDRKAHRSPGLTNKRKSRKTLRRINPFIDHWDSFVERLSSEIRFSVNSADKAPYNRPDSILKRRVYEFVKKYHGSNYTESISKLFDEDRDSERTFKNSFEDMPFHRVLFALKDQIEIPGEFFISKSDVTRFGRQLSYAHRHDIPTELLIGFLLQTGTIHDVCKKAVNSESYEEWYILKLRSSSA